MTSASRAYEQDIRGACGPCDCPQLARLKQQYDTVRSLEQACTTYVREGALAHLDRPEDTEFADPAFTRAYAETQKKLEQEAKPAYDAALTQEAQKGSIIFFLHDLTQQKVARTMPLAEVSRELHITRNDLAPFITINCAHCRRNWGIAV